MSSCPVFIKIPYSAIYIKLKIFEAATVVSGATEVSPPEVSRYTKYTTYVSSITIPLTLPTFFDIKHDTRRIITAAIAKIISILNASAKGTGIMIAERPTTIRILNILLPTIFPMAISVFFFIAAVTDVTL